MNMKTLRPINDGTARRKRARRLHLFACDSAFHILNSPKKPDSFRELGLGLLLFVISPSFPSVS